jgi:hypothetical protein
MNDHWEMTEPVSEIQLSSAICCIEMLRIDVLRERTCKKALEGRVLAAESRVKSLESDLEVSKEKAKTLAMELDSIWKLSILPEGFVYNDELRAALTPKLKDGA